MLRLKTENSNTGESTLSYLDATRELYEETALTSKIGLCCVANQTRFLPDLIIPDVMQKK
jgi:hypothetical protein